jgi:phosphoribosylanthranilate isomerase
VSAANNIAVKICGMRDHQNIMEVANLMPEYLGFIFYPPSPRFVGDDFKLPTNLPPSIKKVGVFVNESNAVILSKSKIVGFDAVQLHGNESAEQGLELKAHGLTVIKVFSIHDDFDFEETRVYKKAVDYFLFDTKGKLYGGNAQTFNWDVLHRYDQDVPFFLSGGLTPDHVGNLRSILEMNIHALDLNSGVEDSPGVKNIGKIKDTIEKTANL